MKRKTWKQVLGVIGGIVFFFYAIGFYECYFNGWPIVKKLCTEPNGGNASYEGGSYWGSGGDNCVVTFRQGESLVSYKVDLKLETAQLVDNESLTRETKYKAIF